MNILVLNGSPKGQNSITIQSVLYLEKQFPKDTFEIHHIGQQLRKYEKPEVLDELIAAIDASDLVLFAYPVYSAVAPYQMHRLLDVLKARRNGAVWEGKCATQLTTSKHFYDFTAHKYIEENAADLGMSTLQGLSADMDDLLTKEGRAQLGSFWDYVHFAYDHHLFIQQPPLERAQGCHYQLKSAPTAQTGDYDVLILTNCKEEDENLKNMIEDYRRMLPTPSRVINIRDYRFQGGCLGCLHCAADGNCVYKDDFQRFLREEVQVADAIVYAATIENHFIGSDFKLTFDRQFCDGHRTTTMGMPVGYILSGAYTKERNLINIIEGRGEVAQHFMLGVASDESTNPLTIQDDLRKLAVKTHYALTQKLQLPQNFLGVGGAKIFRDLIYITGGLMREDHKFYKKHGFYDFPQKRVGERLKMQIIGFLLAQPAVRKNMGGTMQELVVKPYKEAVAKYSETT